MQTARQTLDAAIASAIATHDVSSIGAAVDDVLCVFRDSGFYTDDALRTRLVFRDRILRGLALKKFGGDEKKASSFFAGYLHFRSGDGDSLGPQSSDDAEAWLAGRAANPEYAKHLTARAAADAAFRGKFGTETHTTRKGSIYWTKQYSRAFGP